jgi:competence protein ComEC
MHIRGRIEKGSNNGELPTIAFPEISSIEHGGGNIVKRSLLKIKEKLYSIMRSLFASDKGALLGGLLFGITRDMSDAFLEAMRKSGTTHLVALSGYNILIIVKLVNHAFREWIGRKVSFTLTVIFITSFVLMVGGEASIVRAAIMGALLLIAEQSARPYTTRYAITWAAAIMVLIEPTAVLYNIGFQLSFASLLGIVYLGPALYKFIKRKKREEKSRSMLMEITITTIAAQASVAPLLIAHFETVPLIAFPANITILPAIPITMAIGFIVTMIGTYSLAAAHALSWAPNILLSYIETMIRSTAHIESSITITTWLRPLFFFAYYTFLIGVIVKSMQNGKQGS